ncbi:MAG: galactokinase, partial [Ornithinimicrobium sp.]
ADACVRAENEFAGAPTGGMDQAVVLRARAGNALLLDCATFEAEHVPIPSDAELLVVDTRTHHALTDGQYGGRRAACERAAADLGVSTLASIEVADLAEVLSRLSSDELRGVVRHVVTETARVKDVVARLRSGALSEIGPMLLASHASMRDDFVISTPELDLVVDSAMQGGALGARMTGGGFGGSAVVLCQPGQREAVAARVAGAFDAAGCGQPGMLAVEAVGSAARFS